MEINSENISKDTFSSYLNNSDLNEPYEENLYTEVSMEQTGKNPYSITINTGAHTLTLFKNGQPFKTYPVAVGKASTPTPKGTYKIINKALNPGGAFGVRWLGLNIPGGGYGIHGTNNPGSIGKSISHGCVRMYNNDVIELNKLVPIGTTVKII